MAVRQPTPFAAPEEGAIHVPGITSQGPVPGVSRRDFLAFCGVVAAAIGAGPLLVPDVAAALESLAQRPRVVWSLFQECLGCSVSLLQSTSPDVPSLILRQISLDYHEAVMAPAGHQAEQSFADATAKDFYYVVEGAVATTPKEAITIGGKTAAEIVTSTYKKAKATIAIGACACYGNIQAAAPNPTGAKGVQAFLREDGGIPDATVINIARCPGNAEDMIAALVYVLVYGVVPPLDAVGRPLFLYGQTIHDTCERRAHFEAGEFVETFGDAGSAKRWCFYKVGCKGPVTYAPCASKRWNGRVSWCVHNGPCTGCSEPRFWDTLTPFRSQAAGVQLPGIGGVSAQTVGEALGTATAVGIGAHLVAQVATGRFGRGGAAEMPPSDAVVKGGDPR